MQATIGCLSRIVSRTLTNNIGHNGRGGEPCSTLASSRQGDLDHAHLVTAVSGFPKAQSGTFNIDNILKGQIGDDAYFIARHVDDWSTNNQSNNQSRPHRRRTTSNSSDTDGSSVEQILNPAMTAMSLNNNQNSTSASSTSDNAANASDNATLRVRHQSSTNSADVIGVADGVGGWRQYGVDPGLFSMQLMKSCERLVHAGYFVGNQPVRLLAHGFSEMQESKKSVIGSSTACLAMLNHADGKLYTANIGDSGLLVVRDGKVVHRSSEQQHYFNTPFQLSLPPSEMASDVLSDHPEAADRYEFNVEDGDVIVLATDGIFDNVPDGLIVEQVDQLRGSTNDYHKIQAVANSIALIARNLSRDHTYLSPFSKNARANGFADMMGGKEDDVTVILAAVNLGNRA